MKGGDEDLATDFRCRAFEQANIIQKKRKHRSDFNFILIWSVSFSLFHKINFAKWTMAECLPEHDLLDWSV